MQRTIQLKVLLSASEKKSLVKSASREGMTVSEYTRTLVRAFCESKTPLFGLLPPDP